MKNKSYNCIAIFAITGFLFGLLLNVAVALLNYYASLKGPLFHFLDYSFDSIIIKISPIYLSILLGFIGFVKSKLITFNCIGKAIAQVNEAIIIINVNRVVQWVNDGFVNIYGYSLEEVKGMDISEILHGPLSNKEIGNIMLTKLLKGEAAVGELIIYHKNGEPIWISASVTPILDDSGNIEGYIAISKNISNRKLNELSVDALYKEIADYKFALDQSSSVVMLDLEGNILKANTNFCRINELEENKIIGRNYSLINTSMGNYSIAKPIWNTLYEGLTWKGELINRTASGKIQWAYTTIVPVLDEVGNPHRFLLIEKDITERKLLESQLQINNHKLQTALEIGSIGFWEIDTNNMITLSDELRKIIKEPLNSPIDLAYLFERISPEDVEMIQNNLTITRTTFQNNDMEFQFLVHGEIHYLATSNTAQFNKDGDFIGLFGTMQDVTAFKLIELALKKSEEEKARAMQIALMGSWEIDINGVLTLSDELRIVLKESLDSPIDLAYLFERISAEDVEMIQNNLTSTRTTFQKNEMEFQYLVHGEILYLTTTNTAQFNKEGEFTGLFGTAQDITAFKLAQLALKKSEEEKAKAMEIALIGSWEIDINGVLTLSDELKKLISEPLDAQIDLLYVFERMLPEEVIIMQNNLTITSTTFQKNEMEFQYLVHGKTHYFTSTNTAQFNQAGDFKGLFGTVQDITAVKLIELALKKSEEEKARAMEITLLGSWEIDVNGVLTLSEEIRKIYQLPLEGPINLMEIYKNIPPEDIEIIEDKLSITRLTFEKNDLGFRYFIDEQVHYMISSNIAQFNQRGEFTGLFGTVQDVTAFKLTELALKKSEEEKAVILNNTQAIICIHEMDGTMIYINNAAEKILGFTNEEIVGQNIKDFTNVDDTEILDEYFGNVHTRDKVSGKIHLVTKTGEKRLCLYQNTVYANNGNTPYVIASAIDITSIAAKL